MLKKTCVILLLALPLQFTSGQDKTASTSGLAKQQAFSLAAPISDHMVLQQGKATSIWGTSAAQAEVSIEFAGQKTSTKADENGNWRASLKPLSVSNEPATMIISSGEKQLQVNDILVGEVWMCSGQSNMAYTLERIASVKANIEAVSESTFPLVRFFNTVSKTSMQPERDCSGRWDVMTPQSAGSCSAVAYFFGRRLHETLGTPIGLVNTAWGGKPVEAFTRYEKLQSVPDSLPLLKEWNRIADRYDSAEAKARYENALKKWNLAVAKQKAEAKESGAKQRKLPRKPTLKIRPELEPNYPAAIYNEKIAPWTRYAMAGTIWYQGESNRDRAAQYQSLLTALIEDWRAQWNDDSMPFYIVQLANFLQPSTQPGTPDVWAELQNSQTQVSVTVPNCGLAVINDIGNATDIHPKNKRDVGLRLARLALKKHYGQSIDPYSSPLYKSHLIEGNQVIVTFDHVGKGLKSRDGGELKRFEIAGKDQQWHWADAEIDSSGSKITVSSDAVSSPVAVRYAWAANPKGANLVNSAGLPASLFRTDDWPLSTEGVKTRLAGNTKKKKESSLQQFEKLGYTPLFNGKDLSGWRNPYGHGEAKVVNGEIELLADKKFFLVTEKKYSDFQLIAEIKLPEGPANSGVMFRCHVAPNKVFGYQAECDGSDRCWSAGLYDEGRRGWIWPSKKGRTKDKKFLEREAESQAFFAQPKIHNALKRNDWNRYTIECRGDHISIDLNGVKVTDLRDSTDTEGYVGIQHHGEKGQSYRFRNIVIKELTE